MTKCDVTDCEEIIEYLPFRCKYCGGTFCKKHRLPENHECSFNIPAAKPSDQNAPKDQHQRMYINAESDITDQNQNETEDERLEREMREYIKRQEREARARANVPSRSRPMARSPSGFGLGANQFQVTKWLMGLTIVFFIAGILFAPLLLINLGNIIYIFPLFTAMFTIPLLSFFSLITVIFSLLILYGLGRQIELRFGPKYLLTMYVISGLAGGILVVVSLLLIYVGFPSLASPQQYVSTQYAPILCLVTFFIYLVGLDREMTFFLFFIPVRLKAKYILIFLLIINIIYALLGDLGSLASLMGMLVGKLYYNSYTRHSVSDYY